VFLQRQAKELDMQRQLNKWELYTLIDVTRIYEGLESQNFYRCRKFGGPKITSHLKENIITEKGFRVAEESNHQWTA
jgi:hypothetical protein